jgi:hypothetical protein
MVDRFADIQALRYEANGFDELSPKPKTLGYCLLQAARRGKIFAGVSHIALTCCTMKKSTPVRTGKSVIFPCFPAVYGKPALPVPAFYITSRKSPIL